MSDAKLLQSVAVGVQKWLVQEGLDCGGVRDELLSSINNELVNQNVNAFLFVIDNVIHAGRDF